MFCNWDGMSSNYSLAPHQPYIADLVVYPPMGSTTCQVHSTPPMLRSLLYQFT